jgi:hypothetical protein
MIKMKKIKIIILFMAILALSINQAKADSIARQTFGVNAANTVYVDTTGNFSSTINGGNGVMTSPLSIVFTLTSNNPLPLIRLKAIVTDTDGNSDPAFGCATGTGAPTLSAFLAIGNTTNKPSLNAVNNSRRTDAASSFDANPQAIAYPVTVTADNNGICTYVPGTGDFQITGAGAGQGATTTTNISLSVSQNPKGGTYDLTTGYDTAETYQVQVYLDNLPS